MIMDIADFGDGKKTSTELQSLIMLLLDEGLDPRAIALATCSIGTAMLMHHYGKENGQEVCAGLMREAVAGNLPLYPALNRANRNNADQST